VSVVTV